MKMSTARFTDALNSVIDWLTKAEAYLADEHLVLGDVDTVNILIEKHKLFRHEISRRRGMVEELLSASDSVKSEQSQLQELQDIWLRVNELSNAVEDRLQESLKLAERFRDAIQVVRDWLPEAEAELKFHSIPDDEEGILRLIENHEKFQEELQNQEVNMDRIHHLADEIFQACHPNGIRFIKYYLTITQTRWEQAVTRSNQRIQKLHEALENVRNNAVLFNDLVAWLAECHALLAAKSKDSIPEDLTVVEALIREHQEFHNELSTRSGDVEQVMKSLSGSVGSPSKKTAAGGNRQSESDNNITSPRAASLQNKWTIVWRMSMERGKKLQDLQTRLLEVESCHNFNFDDWRQTYINWNRANKLKFTDFFRGKDKQETGILTRRDFIDGVLASKFPTNATELSAVYDVFDSKRTGRIQFRTFIEAIMRPDRQVLPDSRLGAHPQLTDETVLSQKIEDALSHCRCDTQFSAVRINEAKYKFGEKVSHVRLMNGGVFIRFGSGWMSLEEFLDSNDPCRGRSRFGSSRSISGMKLSGSVSNLTTSSPLQPATSERANNLSAMRSRDFSRSLTNLHSTNTTLSTPTNQRTVTNKAFSTPTKQRLTNTTLSSSSNQRKTPNSLLPASTNQQISESNTTLSSSTAQRTTPNTVLRTSANQRTLHSKAKTATSGTRNTPISQQTNNRTSARSSKTLEASVENSDNQSLSQSSPNLNDVQSQPNSPSVSLSPSQPSPAKSAAQLKINRSLYKLLPTSPVTQASLQQTETLTSTWPRSPYSSNNVSSRTTIATTPVTSPPRSPRDGSNLLFTRSTGTLDNPGRSRTMSGGSSKLSGRRSDSPDPKKLIAPTNRNLTSRQTMNF